MARGAELPHSVEAEQQVLGALLLDNLLMERVEHVIEPAIFYDPVHAQIFTRIGARVADGRVASPVSIGLEMEADPGLATLGGKSYLARLAGYAISPSFIEDYAQMLVDLAMRRAAIEAAESAREAAEQGLQPATEVAQEMEIAAAKIAERSATKKLTASHLSGLTSALSEIVAARKGDTTGVVSTGLARLDKLLGGGLRPGQLIVGAGRPGMAKTSVVQNIAFHAAQSGVGVFFASLEMPHSELSQRFLAKGLAARGHEIAYTRMRQGDLSEAELRLVAEEAKRQESLPIITSERNVRSVDRLRAAARRAQRQMADTACPLGLVVIDYVQLVEVERARDMRHAVTAASDAAKSLALDMGVPVIALSQLNREVERREPPIPIISDMRESGRLEEDADVVALLYRPEVYIRRDLDTAKRRGAGIDELADLEAELSRCRHRLDLIIAKQRSGATATETAHIKPELCHVFEDWAGTSPSTNQGNLI